ncbi:DNA-directed RNA polymerase I subunit [Apiospora phragmitis]|uniref:DNA-directed RNA polymerase subunit n=1 Tax=Apiospora phragmitis TaxID=2905665 RepID=A0ABR1WSK4_9PEZI
MNISQPISSGIDSVDFDFLTPAEIKAISVKRIENPESFDDLNNPLPGGLQDPALGAWAEHQCSTCGLNQINCPGHSGHIDLPVPVYHPVFLDQIMRLLRAQCAYCYRFRMRKEDLALVSCKLRLLQLGLLNEAHYLDKITSDTKDIPGVPSMADESMDNASMERVIQMRVAYTEHALRRHRFATSEIRKGKHEGSAETRREIVKEFFRDMVKGRNCATCKGISPSYRKDQFVKIFEKALSKKDAAKMAQGNFRRKDALTLTLGTKASSEKKKQHHSTDEAIADVELQSSEEEQEPEEEEEPSDEGEGEELDENGDVVMTDAMQKPSRSQKEEPAQRYVGSIEVLSRLNLLFEKEQEMISLLYNSKPQSMQSKPISAESFFVKTVLVPPNKFRPEAMAAGGSLAESDQNGLYKVILNASSRIAQIFGELHKAANSTEHVGRKRDISELHEASAALQDAVNSLIDKDRNPVRGAAAKRQADGIKQKLEKKEGLFRKNMMGKRVNYAARSVISPDPNIETSEIGVPPVFARKLTYPEPVTSHNFREMQQAVINGPDKWPGAAAIENENGQIINLKKKSAEDRVALANQLLAPSNHNENTQKGKKVHRHLGNGDVVLMNRQPTLHKPSIMGHRVRVLPNEKTLRMHYANCNTYNADFDGDEMNMHFPQNELARAEAMQIADTDHQYLSYTAGKPLRGLIQDHLSVSVALCNKDTFLDQGAYHQLVYGALRPEHGHITSDRIELVPSHHLEAPSRWGSKTEEGKVLFQDGEFIHGILDKAHLGPSGGGFIHAIHETWGPETAAKLLSCMGRLLTRYLAMRAFSCGMDDLRLTPEGEKNRKEQLAAASTIGLKAAAKYVSLDENEDITPSDPLLLERLEAVMRNDSQQEGLDTMMNAANSNVSSEVTKACLPDGLEKPFPKNQMQSMTSSGAKGSGVNANLISCNLGQQVLEGRRVPLMVSGKSLPCFRPFETNVRAGGYIVNRFLTGIRPQEYYFHHMAGREGLIDTAVKTSRSGYLQRCLIKGMEGLKVAYDTSVRDADGSMIQFLYGEDGLDITKQKYLHDFGFVLRNRASEVAQLSIDERGWNQDIFSSKEYAQKYMKKAVKEAKANSARARDPISTELNPNRHAFATSEKFYEKLTEYIKNNEDRLLKEKGDKSASTELIARKYAEILLHTKYLNSLVEPGEAVGIVAGQTFGQERYPGYSRLREILMTASDHISTPAMTLMVNEELSEEEITRFSKAISKLPLSHVTDKVVVKERVGKGVGYRLAKIYDIKLQFFKSEEYTNTYGIKIGDVLRVVESKFLTLLEKSIKKEIKARAARDAASAPEIGVKSGNVEMAAPDGERAPRDEDDDDDDDGDDDATNAKSRQNRTEAVSYGPNDDDDDHIQQNMERDGVDDDEDDLPEDEGFGGSPRPEVDDDDDDSDDEATGVDRQKLNRSREARAKERFGAVSQFACDEKRGRWCELSLEFDANMPKILMLSIVQSAVKKTVIQQIEGISDCTYVADEKVKDPATGEEMQRPVIHTNGVNLVAMQKYPHMINPNKTQTNDIAAVLRVYGVEAARSGIIQELSAVFGGHGISVDNRHLNLIGDYMTRNGTFTPFNRMGLRGNVSPFTKMSFETTLAFLKDAVLDGDWDDLTTPSSCIVMGRLSKVGTGAFDVLTRLHAKNGKNQMV